MMPGIIMMELKLCVDVVDAVRNHCILIGTGDIVQLISMKLIIADTLIA
jgi:hypothetical protein